MLNGMEKVVKNNLKIITVVGDSLSMVRSDAEVRLEDLYAYKLQEKLGSGYYVVLRNKRANNTTTQSDHQNLQDDVLCNNSRYIIFHLGIVDCAPRLMTRKERLLLKIFRMDKQTNFYVRFKSRHRRFFTKLFAWQIVTKDEFRDNFLKMIDFVRKTHGDVIKGIVIVNIADTSDINKHRSFNYEKNILEYNKVLLDIVNANRDLCTLIDIYSESKNNINMILNDGMHLSTTGHNLLSRLLYDYIIEKEEHVGI